MDNLGIDWAEVSDTLGESLYRYFIVSMPPEDASDATQETLLRLFHITKSGRFEPNRGNLRMLSYGIAKKIRFEAYRTRKRMKPASPWLEELSVKASPPHSAGSEASQSVDNTVTLTKLVSSLSEDEGEILRLLIDDSLTLSDIALVTGMPLGTIKSIIHRAKAKIRAFAEQSPNLNPSTDRERGP